MYNETLLLIGLFAERPLYRGNLTKTERFCLPACVIITIICRAKKCIYADPLQYQAREQNRLSKVFK